MKPHLCWDSTVIKINVECQILREKASLLTFPKAVSSSLGEKSGRNGLQQGGRLASHISLEPNEKDALIMSHQGNDIDLMS